MSLDRIFNENRVLITNSHFIYTSGLHGSAYINKKVILDDEFLLGKVLSEMINSLPQNKHFDFIIGPETGGAVLATWLSKLMKNTGLIVAKKKENDFFLDTQKNLNGKEVLVLEDVVNTGVSVKKVINKIDKAGGRASLVLAMFNRGDLREVEGVPIIELKKIRLEAYEPENCPFCKKGIPINTNLGHGYKEN